MEISVYKGTETAEGGDLRNITEFWVVNAWNRSWPYISEKIYSHELVDKSEK